MNASMADREWLKRMGEAEDSCESISVGGLASKLGMLEAQETSHPIGCHALDAAFFGELVKYWRMMQQVSIEDFAVRAGLSQREAELLESGSLAFQTRTLDRLSHVMMLSDHKLQWLSAYLKSRQTSSFRENPNSKEGSDPALDAWLLVLSRTENGGVSGLADEEMGHK